MPYTRLFYHLIWSTKQRLPLIEPKQEPGLYAYLKRKANELGCRVLAINGMPEHIHLVMEIPAKISVAEAVKYLKGSSSHEFPEIHWQRSYGALTVSERNLEAAINYVARQKEHHAHRTVMARYEYCEEEGDEGPRAVREEGALYEAEIERLF